MPRVSPPLLKSADSAVAVLTSGKSGNSESRCALVWSPPAQPSGKKWQIQPPFAATWRKPMPAIKAQFGQCLQA